MTTAERDSRREYQDPISPNWCNLVPIPAELAAVKPFGDLVLVRVLPEPEMHANLIHLPQRAAGQREQNNRPRVGEVVAVGLGDRMIPWRCLTGGCFSSAYTTATYPGECPYCGERHWEILRNPVTDKPVIWRHPMHVKPGDKVLFWRVMANTVEIGDELFQFIHEEQGILAVLEAEDGESKAA